MDVGSTAAARYRDRGESAIRHRAGFGVAGGFCPSHAGVAPMLFIGVVRMEAFQFVGKGVGVGSRKFSFAEAANGVEYIQRPAAQARRKLKQDVASEQHNPSG